MVVNLPSITKALGCVSSSTEEEEMKGMLHKNKNNCPWTATGGSPGTCTRVEYKHVVFSLIKVLTRPSETVFQPWALLMPSKTLVIKKKIKTRDSICTEN